MARRSHTSNFFCGQSVVMRNDKALCKLNKKSSNCPHESKINGFNNKWDLKKITLILHVGVPSRPCAVHVCANQLMLAFMPQVEPELCFAPGPCVMSHG